ncbi:hypothetical protein WA158_000784 [Blastocystis sp. Blastoise]
MNLFETYCIDQQFTYKHSSHLYYSNNKQYILTNENIESKAYKDKYIHKIINNILNDVFDRTHQFELNYNYLFENNNNNNNEILIEEDNKIEEIRQQAMKRFDYGLPLSFSKEEKKKEINKKHKKVIKDKKNIENKEEEIISMETISYDEYYNSICYGEFKENNNIQYIPIYIHDSLENGYIVEYIGYKGLYILQRNQIKPLRQSLDYYILSSNTQEKKEISSNESKQMNPLITKSNIPKHLQKYWKQRYRYFSLFDKGIQTDEEGIYSVTPEAIAILIAQKVSCPTVIDCFAGIGGNSIQLARTCFKVFSVDIDIHKLHYLQHNASLYNVNNNIECIHMDSIQLLQICTIPCDVIILAPPWGGPEYGKQDNYSLNNLPLSISGKELFYLARKHTKNIVYLLPRNINKEECIQLADSNECVEIKDYCIDGIVKMTVVFYGNLYKNHIYNSNESLTYKEIIPNQLIEDQITIENNQTISFSIPFYLLSNCSLLNSIYDGHLGLLSNNNIYINTLLESISKDKIMTFCFEDSKGILSFGTIDSSLYKDQIYWFPNQFSSSLFNIPFYTILIDNQPFTTQSFPSSASIDISIPFIYLPPLLYKDLILFFQTYYTNLPSISTTSNIFNDNCLYYFPSSLWPPINLYLYNHTFLSIPPSLYFYPHIINTKTYYCFIFKPNNFSNHNDIILGNSFLHSFTTIFNLYNNSIGFTISNPLSCHNLYEGGINESKYILKQNTSITTIILLILFVLLTLILILYYIFKANGHSLLFKHKFISIPTQSPSINPKISSTTIQNINDIHLYPNTINNNNNNNNRNILQRSALHTGLTPRELNSSPIYQSIYISEEDLHPDIYIETDGSICIDVTDRNNINNINNNINQYSINHHEKYNHELIHHSLNQI